MLISKIMTSPFGKIVGEKSTITANADVGGATAGHSFKVYLKNEAGTEQGYWVWYTVAGVGNNPVTGTFVGIVVNIASGAADTAVAAATRAALIAKAGLTGLAVITGATNQIIITGRWPFDTTNIADVDTGYAFATTTAGSATVALNANLDASGAAGLDFVVRPYRSQTAAGAIYFREIILSVFDTAFTDGTTFAAIAGLANGVSLLVRDITQATIATIGGPLKNNTQLLAFADNAQQMGSIGWFLRFNLVIMFGGEIPIDGGLGQELCLHCADDLTGLTGFYATAYGHATSSIS
jgi:hypothetical protein